MLPNLNRLSLTRTGGSLAFAQWPESEICVLCLYPLTAPPPDGQNVWPFDDEEGITVVACWRQHAFHKGCLRAFVRDSNTTECPECRVPMIPEVLTHVSRPSSGEHAAREAREAAERAEGQERDAEDARRREREMLEQMQREFQEMDAEGRRMHADAYGDPTLSSDEEEELYYEREAQAELDALDGEEEEEEEEEDTQGSEDDENWDAAVDIGFAMRLENRISGAGSRGDRSHRAYMALSAVIGTCIARGSHVSGTVEYRAAIVGVLTNRRDVYNTRAWFHNAIVVCADSICPPAVKGQLLRLLAAYAEVPEVQNQLRAMNAQQRGRASWDAAGSFGAAIRRYVAHLERLPTQFFASVMDGDAEDEATFERNSRDSRLIDAKRVLHYLKWDPLVRDEWLLPYNGRSIVLNEDSDGMLVEDDEGRLMPDIAGVLVDDLVAELGTLGTYDAATEPLAYNGVKANLRALLAGFRAWHARHSGFDEYGLDGDDSVFPFPFGKEVVRLWGLANFMHGVPQALEMDPSQGHIEIEKMERYDQMKEMLTRLVWLGVTWWIGRPYPSGNDSARRDEMEHFFWAYVAPKYREDDDAEAIFKYEDFNDLAMVTSRNGMMRDQWAGDRRSGPWFHNLGMDNAERAAERAERQAQRARDGGETPDARRQRRD